MRYSLLLVLLATLVLSSSFVGCMASSTPAPYLTMPFTATRTASFTPTRTASFTPTQALVKTKARSTPSATVVKSPKPTSTSTVAKAPKPTRTPAPSPTKVKTSSPVHRRTATQTPTATLPTPTPTIPGVDALAARGAETCVTKFVSVPFTWQGVYRGARQMWYWDENWSPHPAYARPYLKFNTVKALCEENELCYVRPLKASRGSRSAAISCRENMQCEGLAASFCV